MQQDLSSTGEWQEYFFPVEMSAAGIQGDLALKFGFGGGNKQQTIEIGATELLNYEHRVKVEALPLTQLTYTGRAADASWRTEAAARIEQYRKGDFTLHIQDANGQDVANADIKVKFQQHDYQFGSVISSQILMANTADSQKYREKVLELFNQSGTENDLKWGPWIGEWGSDYTQSQTLSALQFLRDHGFYVRGHVMVWPSRRNSPRLVQQYMPEAEPAKTDPLVKALILAHIDDIGTATQPYVDEWDVLNEPYDNHDFMDAFGKDVMVDWFTRARQNLPTQKLFINDYSILSAGGRDVAHQDFYANTIQYLLDKGAPINGIGFQCHFGASPTSIVKIYEILNRFGQQFPGLMMRATEFDVQTKDQALQADFLRDFVTIFFSHPATVGVQMWGFWAKAHWIPEAALYTADWMEKPNALAWKKLIYQDWWNDFAGSTNAAGDFSQRGFYGQYQVEVSYKGKTQGFNFHLAKQGESNFKFTLNH
jgi:GH35 family endo-1,4-beta-xylanase